MADLAKTYEARNPGAELLLNFGASSQLALQILDGAPADLFVSANLAQLERVEQGGRLLGGSERFATNRLVLITPLEDVTDIGGLDDLSSDTVRVITAAEGVPIREYTEQLFATLEGHPEFGAAYVEKIRHNIVSEEDNVRLLTAKVALGEASAAIVYRTDVTQDLRDRLLVHELEAGLSPHVVYYLATVSDGSRSSRVQDFIAFILSPEGQAVLERWGFGPP